MTPCLAHSAMRSKQLPSNPNLLRLTTRPLRLAPTRRVRLHTFEAPSLYHPRPRQLCLYISLHTLDWITCTHFSYRARTEVPHPTHGHAHGLPHGRTVGEFVKINACSPTFTSVCLDPTRREKQQQRFCYVPYFIPARVIRRGSSMMTTRAELFVTVYSSLSSDGVLASLRMHTQVTSRHLT